MQPHSEDMMAAMELGYTRALRRLLTVGVAALGIRQVYLASQVDGSSGALSNALALGALLSLLVWAWRHEQRKVVEESEARGKQLLATLQMHAAIVAKQREEQSGEDPSDSASPS